MPNSIPCIPVENSHKKHQQNESQLCMILSIPLVKSPSEGQKVPKCVPRPFRSSLRGNSWPSERGKGRFSLLGITVDGSEIRRENLLRLVVYPIIYRVLYIPGGCLGFQPSTVPYRVRIQYQNISKYLKFFHGHVVEENPTNPIDSFDIHNPWLEYWVFPEYWGVQLDKAQVR